MFLFPPRGKWRGRDRTFALSVPSAETFDGTQGHGKVWVPRGSAPSARRRSSVSRASTSTHLRQPSVIQQCAATRQADTGGRPDGLTAGEMERPERTATPKLPLWGLDTRRRGGRGDTTMLTSVATESLPVQFFFSFFFCFFVTAW